MLKNLQGIVFLLVFLLLPGCNTASSASDKQERILLWHSWPDEAGAELQTLIDDFTSLNPNVRVIVANLDNPQFEFNQQIAPGTTQPRDPLYRRYVEQARLGLGPDVLIGPSGWVRPLADAGLIQNLSGQLVDTSNYLSAAVETMRYQPPGQSASGLYGVPLTLENMAMFYNKTMVTEPAATLDNLLLQARSGQKVALNSGFVPAFWGVQAFGGQLFDENGRVTLDRGGFANWLSWLKTAQTEANIILEDHQETLETLFKNGEVAYVVGNIDILPELQAALGDDVVGVTPLPRGPSQPAGPFLRTQAAMISAYSSRAQSDLALQLAQFLANPAQQTSLMRQASLVPANNQVRVDPQVYPIIAAFLAQAKTAVPFSNLPQMDAIQKYGNEVYLQTFTGAVEPSEAAQLFTNRINQAYGFEPVEVRLVDDECRLSGQLEVWHRWPDSPAGAALQTLADDFTRRCPQVSITLTGLNSDTMRQQYQAVGGQNGGPDMVIAPSLWIPGWADEGLVTDLNGIIDPGLIQQYNSTAVTAMQFNRGLYGMPLWLNLMALYYRANEVSDPPRIADDLLNQASPSRVVLLPVDAMHSAWGAFAFGALAYDDSFQLQIVPDGAVAWLKWLQEARATPGVTLSMDSNELKEIFKAAQASYYAGGSMELNELQLALGGTVLRVAPLPAGPAGEARPQLVAEGLMINPAALADAAQSNLVLAFGSYLSGQEGQTMLMKRANLVPSNINVDTSGNPAISGFLQQVETAGLWRLDAIQSDGEVFQAANQILDTMMERAVFNGEDAAEVVDSLLGELETLGEASP